jgi:hypothetical protein
MSVVGTWVAKLALPSFYGTEDVNEELLLMNKTVRECCLARGSETDNLLSAVTMAISAYCMSAGASRGLVDFYISHLCVMASLVELTVFNRCRLLVLLADFKNHPSAAGRPLFEDFKHKILCYGGNCLAADDINEPEVASQVLCLVQLLVMAGLFKT